MKYKADLHSHSTASDGQYSPTELVKLAKNAGVELLALTDHDTMAGTDEAIRAAEALGGIRVLRGVELGAADHRYMHIVALDPDPGDTPLATLCACLERGRVERMYRIIDFLKKKGVPVTAEEVEAVAGRTAVGRPHFARVMVAKGYVASVKEAFDRYLDTREYQSIERIKYAADECIEGIKASGGKAVLAHPYQLGYSHEEMDRLLKWLKMAGLDAIEVYYRRHTPEQIAEYMAFAKKYDLHISAAGDFHGPKVHPDDAFHPVEIETDWIFEK